MLKNPKWRLLVAGAAMLFWELVLIRWQSNSVRILGYYTNFVLIASFFGLGAGSLMARFRVRLWRFLPLAIPFLLYSSVWLGLRYDVGTSGVEEYIWLGAPGGIEGAQGRNFEALSFGFIIVFFYSATAMVFACFGQLLGNLFKGLDSIKAYSIEVGGSILGILLFAALAHWQSMPFVWVLVGFALLLLVCEPSFLDRSTVAAAGLLSAWLLYTGAAGQLWSPYYKIQTKPLSEVASLHNSVGAIPAGSGHVLTVNNDYHQMCLDLRPRSGEHKFFRDWRTLYDLPYSRQRELPEGPILVVGAGTGNDVAAALRCTSREVHAVEIDPTILRLGRELHPESPYRNPRVRLIEGDARTYFQNTGVRYSLVVFGFLDSHTLLSSFSSLRLDNFVYTEDSFRQVKSLLAPGGQVVVTFASNRDWIHFRILGLLEKVYDSLPAVYQLQNSFSNGIVYSAFKAPLLPGTPAKAAGSRTDGPAVPTDDWPFLYLRQPSIPAHYLGFMSVILVLGFASLLLLPRGERQVRFPYFFLGAGFFLLETSNVVTLSLLFGSTWFVNTSVFIGILALVLLGNKCSTLVKEVDLRWALSVLAVLVLLGYLVPTSAILLIPFQLLRAIVAILVFLSPVFVASLVFAQLIREERNLYQAYGSNLLGAVVGGVSEYFSLVLGFKALLALVMLFYLLAFLSQRRKAGQAQAGIRH